MRRGLFVARPTAASPSNRIVATTAAIELLNLGFIANPEQLQQLPVEELKQLIATAAQLIGADRTWVPMYPGFPEQVMNISDGAVFFNAITHYLTLRQWRTDEHSTLKTASPRVLALVTPDTLMLVNEWEKARALSEADREFVHDLAEYLDTDTAALFQAATFRNGENFATALWDVWYATGGNQDATLSAGLDSARNVDDVLRTVLTVFVDDSERARDLLCSAEHPVNITPIPRRHRVAIITALARFSNDFNLDLLAHRRHLWRRLMRRIHPFDVTGHQEEQRPGAGDLKASRLARLHRLSQPHLRDGHITDDCCGGRTVRAAGKRRSGQARSGSTGGELHGSPSDKQPRSRSIASTSPWVSASPR